MVRNYIVVLQFSSKKEAEQVIDEISNLSESFWNEYDSLEDYNLETPGRNIFFK